MSYIEWLRSQVGTRKIFLSFASIVLRDESGRVLLQRRTDFDAWGLPGGIQELGESVWDYVLSCHLYVSPSHDSLD